MKKKLLLLALSLLLALASAALAEDYTTWGESDWYGSATDQDRIDMAWELLHVLRYAGYPVDDLAAGDLAQAMNDYYDQDKSLSIWLVALTVMGEKLEADGLDGVYFPQMSADEYGVLYENDWYGDTTDDERIAMAWDLLNLVRTVGHPVGIVADFELAQGMNDYFDQDKSLSVWDVAIIVLEEMTQGYYPLMPSDFSAADSAYYADVYENDWYGDATDDERIAMAWELLSILRQSGYAIGHTSAGGFAQAMNDYYDQDKSLSVWDTAETVLQSL